MFYCSNIIYVNVIFIVIFNFTYPQYGNLKLGAVSTNSYRSTSTLRTSPHRSLTSRAHVTQNLESSLILSHAGTTSAAALHATLLSGANSHDGGSEILADRKLNLEAQRLQRRR